MKTFDGLFAELSAKAAGGDPASGTVALLAGGVHAVGKKVVEEAAESWMAAEHEGPGRAAEENAEDRVTEAHDDARQRKRFLDAVRSLL